MKKIIFKSLFLTVLFSLSFSLSANELCKKLFEKQIYVLQSGYPSWILDEQYSVFFSPDRPDEPYVKHNPMLGLYLTRHYKEKRSYTPIIVRKIKSKSRYAMDRETHIKGFIEKEQIGLDLATFSEPVFDNLVITGGCCTIAGLTIGGKRFIETDFIQHFLETDQDYYSDIGARFKSENGSIIVNRVNPFFADNPFRLGDKIITMNGQPPKPYREFLKDILFYKQGGKIKFQIERNGHIFDTEVETKVLLGGGLLSDTFLENLGIWFDGDFYVTNIHSNSLFAKRGLKNNYRLLTINGKSFKNLDEIQKFLSDSSEKMPSSFNFLFEHNSFQFFINLKNTKKMENPFGTNWGSGGSASNDKEHSNDFQNPEALFKRFAKSTQTQQNLSKNEEDLELNNFEYFEIYNKIPLGEYLSL